MPVFQKSQTAYRTDIDGLRALAVVGVLLFHIDHRILGGGFVGVDVFFVISGFLITSLMIRDMELGRFSIARFYERRIRRIFPALFCMIVVSCVAAWFILLPDDMSDLAMSIKYVAISLPNHYFLKEIQDYFSPGVSKLPMLHTWSLGVEEQFYIIFPLLLTTLYRYVGHAGARLAVVATVFLVSLGASCIAVSAHPSEVFFMLPYRAWELILGSLLAMAKLRLARERWNHAAGLAGLLMILASMAIYTEETVFPGLAALAPCVGTGLLILSGADPGAISARLLSWKPLVFVGLISYSVYLWHWPLLVFIKYNSPLDSWSMVAVFIGSLVAGAISWRFIEQPFRQPGFGKRRTVFAVWAVACLLLIGFWHLARRNHGFSNRYSADVLRVLKFKSWGRAYRNQAAKHYRPDEAPVYGAPGVAPDLAVWGDSHARAMLPILDEMAKQRGRAIKHFGINGVPPVVGATLMSVQNPADVSRYTAGTLATLCGDSSIKTVILISAWRHASQFDAADGPRKLISFYERRFDHSNDREVYYASQIQETIRRLLVSGKKVVIIDPIPIAPYMVPDEFAKMLHSGSEPPFSVAFSGFTNEQKWIQEVFDHLEPSDRLTRIRPQDKLISDGRLLLWLDRRPLFSDQNHLSSAGVFLMEGLLVPAFAP